MKITIVGTGYVGLVAGTCFAQIGHEVWCIDVDQTKIDKLKQGIVPIYEPNLDQLIKSNQQAGRLHFSTDFLEGFNQSLFIFIAVGTPPRSDGSADLTYVINVANQIGESINDYKIIVNKSTVPVGTGNNIQNIIANKIKERGLDTDFDVVSNPEFLREGAAIEDFMNPDRIIIGTESQKAKELMTELYSKVCPTKNDELECENPAQILFMDIKSAEIAKYASNAMLATKISFINEISNLCEKVGANIEMVRIGIGSDRRIGYSFINPGIGYGGSCFPKDVKAIINTAKNLGYEMKLLESVEEINRIQKEVLYNKISNYFKSKNTDLNGKTIGIWGLSFKPETDDMREAPSIIIIQKLIEAGAIIHAHDPQAIEEAKKYISSDKIQYFNNQYECLIGCDVMALITEWNQYKQPDFDIIKKNLKTPIIFDGRNQYNPAVMKELDIEYHSIGRQ